MIFFSNATAADRWLYYNSVQSLKTAETVALGGGEHPVQRSFQLDTSQVTETAYLASRVSEYVGVGVLLYGLQHAVRACRKL